MFEKLTKIEIGGYKIPIKCDINVLAAIQEEFSSVKTFERKLIGMNPKLNADGSYKMTADGIIDYTMGEPSYKAIAFGLPLMVIEGISQAEEQGEIIDFDWKTPLKNADFDLIETALAMNSELNRCFERKKKTNLKATTRKKETTK